MAEIIARRIELASTASPEAINCRTHALGFAASIPAAIFLVAEVSRTGSSATLAAFLVYAIALVCLYAASALSHAFEDRPRLRQAFRTADQVCIYLMIAGTFTPFAIQCLPTVFGMAQLVAMWVLAGVGIAIRIRRKGAYIGPTDLALCLATGWIPVLSIAELFSVGGTGGILLVGAGAVFYTGGTVFLMNDHRNPYWHGIWHLATLAGTGCHYLFLLNYVTGA